MSNRIKIYACGGAALNIVAYILKEQSNVKNSSTISPLDTYLIDTSVSNYSKNEQVFTEHKTKLITIPGTDGSGQVRATNISKIQPQIGKIVNENTGDDKDFHLIITSAAGGSGNVIASLLVKELLQKGKNTAMFIIGDLSTAVFAKNTKNTILSLENIASTEGYSIPVHYFENYKEGNKVDSVNSEINYLITDYRLLFSGNIHGVDSMDLRNFYQVTKVSSLEPTVVGIETVLTPVDAKENVLKEEIDKVVQYVLEDKSINDVSTVAMISVETNDTENRQLIDCEYRVEGTIDYKGSVAKSNRNNVHFVTLDSLFPLLLKRLDDIIKTHENKINTRVKHQIEIDNSNIDSSGIVL